MGTFGTEIDIMKMQEGKGGYGLAFFRKKSGYPIGSKLTFRMDVLC